MPEKQKPGRVGRPPGKVYTQVRNIRLSDNDMLRLLALCHEWGASQSEVMRRLLEAAWPDLQRAAAIAGQPPAPPPQEPNP